MFIVDRTGMVKLSTTSVAGREIGIDGIWCAIGPKGHGVLRYECKFRSGMFKSMAKVKFLKVVRIPIDLGGSKHRQY